MSAAHAAMRASGGPRALWHHDKHTAHFCPMSSAHATSLRAIQRQFDRRVTRFREHDFLFREAQTRIFERLDLVRADPAQVLDLGCGQGRELDALAQRFPQARLVGVDVSGRALAAARAQWRGPRSAWWRDWLGKRAQRLDLVQASFAALPFADAQFDMLYSNLALHFTADTYATLLEWARVSREGGLLMFSCFGPDTLKEVRAAMAQVLATPAVIPYEDMHDLGDMLLQAGFADPVVDMEYLTLTYRDVDTLLRELRAVTGNPLVARAHALGGRKRLQGLRAALEAQRGSDGLLRVTIELVNGHGWRAAPRQHSARAADGASITHVPFDRLKRQRTDRGPGV